jgi:cytochrome b561
VPRNDKNSIQDSTLVADDRYDATTIWLHWTTVLLVVVLWGIGMTADWLPRGTARSGVWSTHVILGILTALVLVTRIAWRASFGRVLPPADTGFLYVLAVATHRILYVLLAAVVVTGIINASYRGFHLFGTWSVPQFGTGDVATRRTINWSHELAANVLLFIAFLHACAALIHQYVWRDNLLNRMRP